MKDERKAECSAFCPICGSDLFFLKGVCYCKNEKCNYKCDQCKKESDKLHFSDEK